MNIYVYNVHIDIYSYICMFVCTYVCMYVCMYVRSIVYMYVYVCILFHFSHSIPGSQVSVAVGVGPWNCKLKVPSSNPLCVLRSFEQALFSWLGGGGVIQHRYEGKNPQHFGII
jgi:hypothetical protein